MLSEISPLYTHLFPFFIHLSECKYTYIYTYIYIFLFIQFVSFIVNVVSTRCLFIFRFPCKRDFYLIPLHYITYTHAPHKLLSGFFLSFGNKNFFLFCVQNILLTRWSLLGSPVIGAFAKLLFCKRSKETNNSCP